MLGDKCENVTCRKVDGSFVTEKTKPECSSSPLACESVRVNSLNSTHDTCFLCISYGRCFLKFHDDDFTVVMMCSCLPVTLWFTDLL